MPRAATTLPAAETLTDTMIRELHSEARAAQDDVQRIICDIALGDEEPTPTGESFEERFGGGGFDHAETRAIMAIKTVDDARRECAEVITHARAMACDDASELVTVVA